MWVISDHVNIMTWWKLIATNKETLKKWETICLSQTNKSARWITGFIDEIQSLICFLKRKRHYNEYSTKIFKIEICLLKEYTKYVLPIHTYTKYHSYHSIKYHQRTLKKILHLPWKFWKLIIPTLKKMC